MLDQNTKLLLRRRLIADATPASVADVVFAQQILFIDIPLGAVRSGSLARAPQFGQSEAIITIDHLHIGIEKFLLRNVTLIDIGHLEAIEVLHRARGLGGPQIAAL